jgi:hypothetical protein
MGLLLPHDDDLSVRLALFNVGQRLDGLVERERPSSTGRSAPLS